MTKILLRKALFEVRNPSWLTKKFINNFSTLVATDSQAMSRISSSQRRLIYSPDLVFEGEESLKAKIQKHRPTVLVVGANKVGKDVLEMWRNIFNETTINGEYKQPLSIIRRGTSIAAIDVRKASKLGIDVVNTPNVNAVEVAKSVYSALCGLEEQNFSENLGLIGFGYIGRKLAQQALSDGRKIIAYSPSLYSSYQEGKRFFKGFDIDTIHVAGSIEELIEESDALVVSATIGQYGNGKVIGADNLDGLKPEAKIVCVSEPEVFSSKALEALATASHEKNVKVIFDNSPYMMKKLQKEIEEFGGKMSNFTFQSKVMSSLSCQRDMDIAAVALLLKNALSKKLPEIHRDLENYEFQIQEAQKKVRIVGSGISAMIASLYFQEKGYSIEIFEKDSEDNLQGITRSGPDVRHLSYTETITHATTNRIKDWLFEKITDGSFFEKLFAQQFQVIGDNAPLVALLQSVVAEINKIAIKGERGWKYLAEKYPQIFSGNLFGSGKVLRVFSTKEELDNAFKLQNSVHDKDEVRIVEQEELVQKMPFLQHLVDENKIAGAVEVVGYGVRVISLCNAIEKFLFEQSGVKVKWQQEVQKEGEKFFVKDQFGNQHELEKEVPLVISSGVSQLVAESQDINRVYGLFVSIPNCGVTEVFKIHEKDPLGVMNITPSKDGKVLHISAGFQYFGQREAAEADLQSLFLQLEQKICELFPQSYAQGVAQNSVERKFCPRPMTAHGLPKFTKFQGGVFVGGTNSGGTVEATILGQLALLQTQYDDGLFKKNLELNESVEGFLEVARNCFSYISNAITEENVVSGVVKQANAKVITNESKLEREK